MSSDSISLRQVAIGYRQKKLTRTVADGLSATVRRGELTCLLGANGVGKSTLLRTLAAFQPKTAGEILIEGRNIDDYGAADYSTTVSVVLTEKPELASMSVRELVSMGRAPYTDFWGRCTAEDWYAVDDALQKVGVSHLAQRMADTLSDGERQKVMIAKALAQQTPIILLDEPTAFLDFPSKVEVMLLLSRISHEERKAIFLSTHDLELALQTADSVWLMERTLAPGEGTPGTRLITGTPRQLADSGAIGRFVSGREGISFDPATMTVKIKGPERQ